MCHGKAVWGGIVLVLGILLLLKDTGVWDFWNITPWTLVFLVVGLAVLLKSKESKKKKK
ncbi:MAG: hypothetical protein R6U32_04770 [Candidatus Woesearchaeota archaeon]